MTALGLNHGDVNSTLSTAWGGRYVNDFIDRGRVKRVYVQGDAPYRSEPDRRRPMVRPQRPGRDGAVLARSRRPAGRPAPSSLSRFLGVPVLRDSRARPAPGVSSGEAMDSIEKLAVADSRHQRRLGRAVLSGAAVVRPGAVALRDLAAGRVPVPRGALRKLVDPGRGAAGHPAGPGRRDLRRDAARAAERRLSADRAAHDHGPAAKNAILMIEFAERAEKQGKRVIDAAIEAARIRLRPILMTSFAFIFGVLPLAISTGAGANSRIAIGTSVIGGMLTATLLGDLLHSAVLRAGPARRARRHRRSSASASAARREAQA